MLLTCKRKMTSQGVLYNTEPDSKRQSKSIYINFDLPQASYLNRSWVEFIYRSSVYDKPDVPPTLFVWSNAHYHRTSIHLSSDNYKQTKPTCWYITFTTSMKLILELLTCGQLTLNGKCFINYTAFVSPSDKHCNVRTS